MKKKKYLIGIDIGGTKMMAALLDRRFRLLASSKCRVELEKGEKGFLKTLDETVAEILAKKRLKLRQVLALGVGCPGMIDFASGKVTYSPNIPFLKNYPLRTVLKKRFHLPVVVENDVNAGIYGEYQFGAARGARNVVGIFLGTGVGGGLILDGKLYRGTTGAAGEIGHTFLSLPASFEENRDGTVERMLGRLAIAAEAGMLMLRERARHLHQAVDYDIKKIKSGVLSRSIRSGDSDLRELILRKARILGMAMANIVNLLNPERIVLGGGLMEAMGDLILPQAVKTMEKYALKPVVKSVKVVAAQLKDYAGAQGAAKLALDSLD
ncbi:MAG: ROK family protein [Candidatus Omnitrophota bacterium]